MASAIIRHHSGTQAWASSTSYLAGSPTYPKVSLMYLNEIIKEHKPKVSLM